MEKRSTGHRNMDELKNSFEIEKGNEVWNGQELETQSAPLVDPGSGRPIVVRQFEFSWNPAITQKPSKQELFNFHAREIRNYLWRDGLVIREDVEPRLMYEETGYRIFITCEAKGAIIETPRNLTEVLNK